MPQACWLKQRKGNNQLNYSLLVRFGNQAWNHSVLITPSCLIAPSGFANDAHQLGHLCCGVVATGRLHDGHAAEGFGMWTDHHTACDKGIKYRQPVTLYPTNSNGTWFLKPGIILFIQDAGMIRSYVFGTGSVHTRMAAFPCAMALLALTWTGLT